MAALWHINMTLAKNPVPSLRPFSSWHLAGEVSFGGKLLVRLNRIYEKKNTLQLIFLFWPGNIWNKSDLSLCLQYFSLETHFARCDNMFAKKEWSLQSQQRLFALHQQRRRTKESYIYPLLQIDFGSCLHSSWVLNLQSLQGWLWRWWLYLSNIFWEF